MSCASNLSCPLCKNPFDTSLREPHVAPCGHSICSVCVRDLRSRKFVQCAVCAAGYPVSEFPPNFGLREQLKSLAASRCVDSSEDSDEKSREESDLSWRCSDCSFPLHPRQARICIRCTPHSVAENTVTELLLHDYDACESSLVCAHCVMESKHRFHISKLYLPIKIRQCAAERFDQLAERASSSASNRDEASLLTEAVHVLRERASRASSWRDFERQWTEAESLAGGVGSLNGLISEGMHEAEAVLARVQQHRNKKQELLVRLTDLLSSSPSAVEDDCDLPPVVPSRCAARKTLIGSRRRELEKSQLAHALVRRRSSSSDCRSTSSSSSSLRRFAASPDLTQVGAEVPLP